MTDARVDRLDATTARRQPVTSDLRCALVFAVCLAFWYGPEVVADQTDESPAERPPGNPGTTFKLPQM